MVMKVVQDIDVDNKTTKLEGNKLLAQLVFTEREATVPASAVQQFVFRELDNANQIMACTGIQVNGQWYGDRPDDGVYVNPFTNEQLRRGEPPRDMVEFLYKETWSGNVVELNNWTGPQPVMSFTAAGGTGGTGQPVEPQVQQTTANGQPAANYTFQLGGMSVRFQDTERVHFTLDGETYTINNLPRLAFENSLGTFGVVANSVDEVKAKLRELSD